MKWRALLAYPGLITVCVTILLALGTFWLLASHSRGAEIAGVLSLTVAAVGLAAPILQQARKHDPAELARAAYSLARDVSARDAAQQQKFLADSGQAVPADVSFSQPRLLHWRTDGGRQRGSLKDIEGFYSGLTHGRLVVLGGAGAGKTVLANQLLLDLISAMPTGQGSQDTTLQVPMRISLPSFNPTDPSDPDGGRLREQLDDWISRYLVNVHGLSFSKARILVTQGWILPILDGLDEMDHTPDPIRARAVIRALNHPVGPGLRPVVLTCRTELYEHLANAASLPGEKPILEDATAVRIQPLTVHQVQAYLTRRFPDPAHPNRAQARWKPVLLDLSANPQGPLAIALSSPFYLYLVVTAYHSGSTCPAELIHLPSARLTPHLLNRLVPAVARQRPKPDGTFYDPSDVTRWLMTIAVHLNRRRTRHGDPGTDIRVDELWAAAGERIPRYIAAVLLALLTSVILLANSLGAHALSNSVKFFIFHLAYMPFLQPGTAADRRITKFVNDHAEFVTFLMLLVIAGFYCFLQAKKTSVVLNRLDMSALRTRSGRRRLALGLGAGNAVWALLMLIWAYLQGHPYEWLPSLYPGALSFGPSQFFLMIGLMGGAAGGLASQPSAVRRPGQVVTQGLTHDFVILICFGMIVTIIGGNTAFGGFYWFAFEFGLLCGFMWLADSPWPRYICSMCILAIRGHLPLRCASFLDWAYEAGLLRFAGVSSQFRHSELQEHLTRAPKEE